MTAVHTGRPVLGPARRTGRAAGLTTELVTSEAEFAALGPAWRRLYERCPAATPFQSHAWLHSWWRSYGRPGRLRVLLVRSGGELVAAAPLMRAYRPLPALVPLGGAISDYTDVLIDAGEPRAAVALTAALARAARTALVDLGEVRPGAAAERVHELWRGPRRAVAGSLCLELPALPLAELTARLSSAKAAQRVRAKLRRLDSLGVERRTVPPEEAEAAVRRLLELHRLQWQGRGVTTEHLRPRFLRHLTGAAGPMVRAGDAVLTEFRIGAEVLAVDLTLLAPGLAGGYLYGADPGLRDRKADVAVMLLEACAEQAVRVAGDGPGRLSLLRGDEPYKRHWRPEPALNRRLLLARRTSAPLLTAALCGAAARQRGRELVHRWRAYRRQGTGTR